MLRTYQRGFTLIEIAIVLVIIGLLLGGVLKGQELITSARVRNLIAQQDGIKAAFFGFQDRFRSMPGDYATASTTLKCPSGTTCLNGNGNGIIEDAAVPVTIGGVASETTESLL
ncbi:MAG: prepilin-type N-terminal cleavage/methylation domain-containing protein, partial [Burkholderiales bacterium]